MKTKIIATTRYVDNKDYIFDEQIPLKRDEVEKLSNFSVRDCRIIKDDEADVIAINYREIDDCEMQERVLGLLNHFCEVDDDIYMLLHRRTDLPGNPPIGEFLGWRKELDAYKNLHIWAMIHQPSQDRGAFILTKKAYDGKLTASDVMQRVESIFLIEKIFHLWDDYQEGDEETLNHIISSIEKLQDYSFIQPHIDIEVFKGLSWLLQYNKLQIFGGKSPNVFNCYGE